jgi:tRNA threonylcarbamoyladenosine biosynthesis protein TsaB
LRILALDSSSPLLSIALVDDGRVLSQSLHEARAGDLLPAVLGPLEGVDAVAVGLGPGSFTGLRVGLAAAKALAYAKRWPIAGASSLLALARGAAALLQPGSTEPRLICATLEARRGELYASLHRGGELVWPEAVYRAEALLEKLRTLDALLVGPGAHANRDVLGGLAIADEPRAPPAAQIALLCEGALRGKSYDAEACFSLAPNYLQPSTAEVALAEGRVGGLSRR